jgi:hypothetical protein
VPISAVRLKKKRKNFKKKFKKIRIPDDGCFFFFFFFSFSFYLALITDAHPIPRRYDSRSRGHEGGAPPPRRGFGADRRAPPPQSQPKRDLPPREPDEWEYQGGRRTREHHEAKEREMRNQASVPREPPFSAFVGNLSWDATEQDVGSFFERSRRAYVRRVRLIVDRDTHKPRGFGYVEFEDRGSLVEALKMDGTELKGRTLHIDVAQPQQERSPRPHQPPQQQPLSPREPEKEKEKEERRE